jgi:nodulation protein E
MADCGADRRVVVTGMGVVTPIGQTVTDFWTSLKRAKSGIAPLEGVPLEQLKVRIAAQVRNFDQTARLRHWQRDPTILHSDRYSWLAAAAADEAIQQSGLEAPFRHPDRAACIIGSGAGGQITAETACRDRFIDQKRAVHPMTVMRTISSSAAAHIGIEYGVKGPTFAICSAGSSAAHAVGIGRDLIRNSVADVAIVGGTDSMITYGAILASQSLRLLSPQGCFPFAGNRNGTVLAEGAGVLVLESQAHAVARGARMLAEFCGFGMTSNSKDMVSLDVEAASAAMDLALADARLKPTAIDYLNANGTGTVCNDRNETAAIKKVFGRHAYKLGISSTKSMHGHPFGAAGGIEGVACVKAMEAGWMPPTIGLLEKDPDCDLDYVPNVGRERNLTYTMSNNFALGGLNAVLIFGPAPV